MTNVWIGVKRGKGQMWIRWLGGWKHYTEDPNLLVVVPDQYKTCQIKAVPLRIWIDGIQEEYEFHRFTAIYDDGTRMVTKHITSNPAYITVYEGMSIGVMFYRIFPDPEEPPPLTYTCDVCGAEFTDQAQMIEHRATHDPSPIPTPTGCFIATASYGVDHPRLQDFRRFRDRCLPSSVTDFYYRWGKYPAKLIRRHRFLRMGAWRLREWIRCLTKMIS